MFDITHKAYIRSLRNHGNRATAPKILRTPIEGSSDSALPELLKKWRAEQRLSQAEAATILGISPRTLQGWEIGRPMPYPHLLQRAVASRSVDRYGLVQADFPAELAEFINFVGSESLDSAVRTVIRKLEPFSPQGRAAYSDKYFFHQQVLSFCDGSRPFHLDVTDLGVVRAASFVAGINRIARTVSPRGATRLRGMMLDNLKRDMRQIEHEVRCSVHFGRKGFDLEFADIEGKASFDLLAKSPTRQFEVEAKTVSEDTGSQIKLDLTVELTEIFRKSILRRAVIDKSGLYVLTLKKPSAECKHIGRQLSAALQTEASDFDETQFSMEFLRRPQWDGLLASNRTIDLQAQILADPEIEDRARCAVRVGEFCVGLVLVPHKPTSLRQRLVGTIKEASDQCSGQRPAIVWLHLVGFEQAEFLKLTELSSDGRGQGLNAVVADALHSSRRGNSRSHVERVRFSVTPQALHSYATLGPELLIRPAVSTDGAAYDVPLPHCQFPSLGDL